MDGAGFDHCRRQPSAVLDSEISVQLRVGHVRVPDTYRGVRMACQQLSGPRANPVAFVLRLDGAERYRAAGGGGGCQEKLVDEFEGLATEESGRRRRQVRWGGHGRRWNLEQL